MNLYFRKLYETDVFTLFMCNDNVYKNIVEILNT